MSEWAEALDAWEIPEDLLEQAEESPYGWPVALWQRRAETASDEEETPTQRAVLSMGAESVIDIGAGTGRSCLAYAAEGLRVVAVEKDPGMAAGLREAAERRRLSIEVIEGEWPRVFAPVLDVVTCSHVVYDVPTLGPFLHAMTSHARLGVVIELSTEHPWAHLAPYYRALHDLDRPDGPTLDDFLDVVRSVAGKDPVVVRWERPGGLWFESWDEILDLYAKRLVLPAARREELRDLLASEVREEDGRLFVGASTRSLATVSWKV